MALFFYYSLALLFCTVVQGLNNITVDDTNVTAIEYKPPSCGGPAGLDRWHQNSQIDADHAYFGSTLSNCDQPGGMATLKFTGIAVYLFSPLWPYPFSFMATIDSSAGVAVNLTDPNAPLDVNGFPTASSQVVWSAGGLENVEHTLLLSNGVSDRGQPGPQLPVDGFIYTALGDPPAPGSSSGSLPSQSPRSSNAPTSSPSQGSTSLSHPKSMAGAIAGGIIGSLAVLASILLLLWYRWKRNREEPDIRVHRVFHDVEKSSQPGPVPTSFIQSAVTPATDSGTNIDVSYEPSPPSYEDSSSRANTVIVDELASWAAANRQYVDLGLENKLRAASYHPDTDPDAITAERWEAQYGVGDFELIRLRELYSRGREGENGNDGTGPGRSLENPRRVRKKRRMPAALVTLSDD